MRIKRDDTVVVICGDNKANTPRRVINVLDGGKRIVVEGVNRVLRHVRKGHPKSPAGGRLQLELPIDASNVLLYCPSCGKGTRTGSRYLDDGGKERYCKKCGASAGQISPAKARYAR